MKKIQAIKGMKDLLPSDSSAWQYVEATIIDVLQAYGYQEIRFPIIEQTDLFKRGIGEATDIVEKEMYTFADRDGDMITLRPEGTASCVRACEQHQLLFDRGTLTQKLWYSGPMFRHEKPQKGRLRQFHQFGVECFGYSGPDIDAELLIMTARLWRQFGILDSVCLEINSLGTTDARKAHRVALVEYFETHKDALDEDSPRRLKTNPLRILDSKIEQTQALVAEAPTLLSFLDEASKRQFDELCALLDAVGVRYKVNPLLVRGLDYYSETVFEWVTDKLGAQGTICGGGRYDGLVTQLGGRATPAIGLAMGIERLVLLLQELNLFPSEVYQSLDVYVVAMGNVQQQAFSLAETIRDLVPGIRVQLHCGGGSFRSQMKKADKSGANIALVLGEDEVARNEVAVKYLRDDREQIKVKQDQLKTILVQE